MKHDEVAKNYFKHNMNYFLAQTKNLHTYPQLRKEM